MSSSIGINHICGYYNQTFVTKSLQQNIVLISLNKGIIKGKSKKNSILAQRLVSSKELLANFNVDKL